jgi:23S rRNA pseudouridine1911/1915/1917 synthase
VGDVGLSLAKSTNIQLGTALTIPIVYENRSALAIDKPAGWMLAPNDWDRTGRNLALALLSSIEQREFWASSRNLKFLRHVHRLDADTSGVLLFAKSAGALTVYSRLFETRSVEKTYLAVCEGTPSAPAWTCRQPIGEDPSRAGRMLIDSRTGREAETNFRLLQQIGPLALIEARPLTGRSHQIRLHLLASGLPILGDSLYGKTSAAPTPREFPMALRAVELGFTDPFLRKPIRIRADSARFAKAYGFQPLTPAPHGLPPR